MCHDRSGWKDHHHNHPSAIESNVPHVRQSPAALGRASRVQWEGARVHGVLLVFEVCSGDSHEPRGVLAGLSNGAGD